MTSIVPQGQAFQPLKPVTLPLIGTTERIAAESGVPAGNVLSFLDAAKSDRTCDRATSKARSGAPRRGGGATQQSGVALQNPPPIAFGVDRVLWSSFPHRWHATYCPPPSTFLLIHLCQPTLHRSDLATISPHTRGWSIPSVAHRGTHRNGRSRSDRSGAV